MRARLGVVVAVVAWLAAAPARGAAFTGLVNFGDSLSDVGNAYAATSGAVPAAPGYSAGRFSNGSIWLQQLATKLGVPAVTASLSGGNDFAYGGVTTGTGTTSGFPNIRTQINGWTAAHTANTGQLFTVLGGANDLFGDIDGSNTTTTATTAADNIAAGVGTLYADGARNVLVANLPDLGKLPAYRGTAASAPATTLTGAFNTELANDLTALQASSPGLTLYRLDLFALFNAVIATPGNYGLTNVTDAAYTGATGFGGNGTVNPNAATYLFWDQIHPTTTGHAIIANAAFAAVPEPATLGLLLIAATTLLSRHRPRNSARAGAQLSGDSLV